MVTCCATIAPLLISSTTCHNDICGLLSGNVPTGSSRFWWCLLHISRRFFLNQYHQHLTSVEGAALSCAKDCAGACSIFAVSILNDISAGVGIAGVCGCDGDTFALLLELVLGVEEFVVVMMVVLVVDILFPKCSLSKSKFSCYIQCSKSQSQHRKSPMHQKVLHQQGSQLQFDMPIASCAGANNLLGVPVLLLKTPWAPLPTFLTPPKKLFKSPPPLLKTFPPLVVIGTLPPGGFTGGFAPPPTKYKQAHQLQHLPI
jgi:hypothetical protein